MVNKMLAMACCKVYISESRNLHALDAIAASARAATHASLLHIFTDHAYNRVGFTLAGLLKHPQSGLSLGSAVLSMVKTAIDHLDLQIHSGCHPRLGIVDHVCFHPLGDSTLQSVAGLARCLARSIGTDLKVPTYLYGAAHPDSASLDSIRRRLGYFSAMGNGVWEGAIGADQLCLPPDFGPVVASAKTGAVAVGACPWIANYNIPIPSTDLQLGRRIARQLSTRGGGLPAVQAIALLHGPQIMEIACNLTDCAVTSAETVQEEVSRLAQREGLSVDAGYFTGHSQDEITEMATQRLSAT